jgi:hypothetical protein
MMPTAITVPIDVINTLNPEGYEERFWQLVQASAMNHRQAWETIETERAFYGIPERYTSYESFRAARCASRGEKNDGN